MSESEEYEQCVPNNPSKKKCKGASEYKQNKIKEAILKGEAYENYKGRQVPAKRPLLDCG